MPSLNIVRFAQRLRASRAADDTLRDLTRTMRLNIAAAHLAPSLFVAHLELARVRGSWDALTPIQKQRWIDVAATTLDVGEFTARVLRNAPR